MISNFQLSDQRKHVFHEQSTDSHLEFMWSLQYSVAWFSVQLCSFKGAFFLFTFACYKEYYTVVALVLTFSDSLFWFTHTHTHTPTCLAYTSEDSYVLIYKVRLEVHWGPRSADPPKMVKHDVFGVFSQRFPRTRFWVLGRCRVLGVS